MSTDQSTSKSTMEGHQSNLVVVEAPKKDQYWRIKQISFLLLKSEKKGKEERLVLYDNTAFAIFVWLVLFVELVKNLYFCLVPLSIEHRVLFGDIIISKQVGILRMFNLFMVVMYLAACFPFFVPYFFVEDYRKSFHRLSDFLVVHSLDKFTERFSVSRKFAGRFIKQLDYQVWFTHILFWSYSLLSYSLITKNIYLSLKLGYSYSQILTYTVPSILNGGLALTFIFKLVFPCFTLFTLHARLLKAKVHWLVEQLKGLGAKATQQAVDEHLVRLNLAIREFETSRRYFNSCLSSCFFAFLSAFALFPSMVIVSGLLINQLTGFFIGNVTIIIYLIKLNESLGREFTIYLNGVHRFVQRRKRLKRKLVKIFDIVQPENPLSYTLLSGLIQLNSKTILEFLIECVAITFLIYAFFFYSTIQN